MALSANPYIFRVTYSIIINYSFEPQSHFLFSVDASSAGAGNLEIIVSANGRNVPNYVQSEGNAKFRVNFKPTEPSTHVLSVKFNGEPVPGMHCISLDTLRFNLMLMIGSPYLVKVVDSTQSIISGQTLRMAALGKGVEFCVENRNDECKECKAVVTSECLVIGFTNSNHLMLLFRSIWQEDRDRDQRKAKWICS